MRETNFDSVAGVYDILGSCIFGDRFERLEHACVQALDPKADILVLGPGRGRILRQILEKENFKGSLVAFDTSSRMLDACESGLLHISEERKDKIELHHLSWEQAFPRHVDVIVLPFFADMFQEDKLQRLFKLCSHNLRMGGRLYLLDFFEPESGSKIERVVQRALLRSMYLFFRLSCSIEAKKLPPYEICWRNAGFRPIVLQSFDHGFMRLVELRCH